MLFHFGMFKSIMKRRWLCDDCDERVDVGEVVVVCDEHARQYIRLCRDCVALRGADLGFARRFRIMNSGLGVRYGRGYDLS